MAIVAGKRNEAKRWEVIFDTVGTRSQKTFGRSSFSGERNQQAVRTWKSNRKCRYGIPDADVVALSGTAGADVGRIEKDDGRQGEAVPQHRGDRRNISCDFITVKEGLMDVNLIFKIAAVGILVSVLSQVLKHSGREEQAFLTSLAGLLLVLFWIVPYIYELFESIKRLFSL